MSVTTTPNETRGNLRLDMARMAPEFAKLLPPGMTADRFTRVALTAIQNNPDLMEADQASLWNACMKAAQDGLLPDGREGALVTHFDRKKGKLLATWMPMVQGLIAKAKRKGSVASLAANIVYRSEEFEVLMGDDDRIVHRRDVTLVKGGAEIAVYAIATLKDGTKEREVMSWQQVMDVKAASKGKGEYGPWKDWAGEMARKTVIRRLSKRLPNLDDGDDDLRQAIERVDEHYDFGRPASAGPALSAPATRAALSAPSSTTPVDITPQRDRVPAEIHDAETGEVLPQRETPRADPTTTPFPRMTRGADLVHSASAEEWQKGCLGTVKAFVEVGGHAVGAWKGDMEPLIEAVEKVAPDSARAVRAAVTAALDAAAEPGEHDDPADASEPAPAEG